MIARLVLTLALLSLPASVAAREPVPVPVPVGIDCPAPELVAGETLTPDELTFECLVSMASSPSIAQVVAGEPQPIVALVAPDGLAVRVQNGRIGITDGMLYGTVGCNEYSGAVDLSSDNYLSFMTTLASTAKYCPDLDGVETLFAQILAGADLRLEEGQIVSENGAIIVDTSSVLRGGSIDMIAGPIQGHGVVHPDPADSDDEMYQEMHEGMHGAMGHAHADGAVLHLLSMMNAFVGSIVLAPFAALLRVAESSALLALALGGLGGFLVGRANPAAVTTVTADRPATRRRTKRGK